MSHTLTVTRDDRDDYPPDVEFECTNGPEASCRNYPSGAAEWDEGDPDSTPQDECWVQGWFDAGQYRLEGGCADTDGWLYGGEDSVPNVTDRFEVEVEFIGDGVAFQRVSADADRE